MLNVFSLGREEAQIVVLRAMEGDLSSGSWLCSRCFSFDSLQICPSSSDIALTFKDESARDDFKTDEAHLEFKVRDMLSSTHDSKAAHARVSRRGWTTISSRM